MKMKKFIVSFKINNASILYLDHGAGKKYFCNGAVDLTARTKIPNFDHAEYVCVNFKVPTVFFIFNLNKIGFCLQYS